MQYLVLRQFRSIGKMLHKGTIVDASQIRSPRLRQSEGKIIPAVSSFTIPAEPDPLQQAPQAGKTGVAIDTPKTAKLQLFFAKKD